MDIVLVGGLWLDGSAWDRVTAALEGHGHRAVPVTLPGQGDGDASATLADQVTAIVEVVDASASRPMVVGHSAACTLAWLAADARPEKVGAVALVGGFPSGDGDTYADFFPVHGGVMPFPGWEPFAGADSDDLDQVTKDALAADAIPVPESVARGVVRLTDERRYDVPVVVMCPEFSPADAKMAIDGGDVPELAKAARVSFVDIDSGHWPMFSAPDELAGLLSTVAEDARHAV